MTTDTVPQTVLFPDLFDKPLFARFNQEQASSDGGAILLKAAERIYGLVKAFAGCLFDKRAPDKTRHSLADLIGQRIFGIACGHPDCNDGDRLAEDPIHKLLLDRDPVSGERLASQPTLSRFENAVNGCALYRMADELATRVIARHRRRLDGRARCITIDLDPTDDPTHGAQQYTLFNGYYDNWCYLPLLGFLTFDRESEQYLCAALLRHGKAVASEGTVGLLSRLLPRLRRAFPRARILVRLDGGFASPAVFAFLEAQPRLDYVVAMAKNAVLERYAEPAMLVARARTWRSEQTEHVYTETDEYQAGTWNHARRVVIKAEVVRHRDREPRDNPRFVVTNMRQTPRFLYEKVYCARGDAENRIKELKALQIDRTSCQTFSANQASSAESVGEFWFGQVAKCVIQSDFQCPGGAEPIRPFGDHSGLPVEAFDNATGELPPGSEPVQDQVAVRAHHAGNILHRFEPRAQRPSAPAVEELSGPVRRHVAPQRLEVLLEQVGANRAQVATHQFRKPFRLPVGEILRTLEQEPAAVLEHRRPALGGELAGLGRAHFVDCLREVAHDVEAVEHLHRLPGAFGDHLQVGLPHVRAHEVQRRAACGAEPVEEALQCRGLAFASDPQQTLAVAVDLIDQRQVALPAAAR